MQTLIREESTVHVNSLASLTRFSRGRRKHQNVGLHDLCDFEPGGELDVLNASAILKQLEPTRCCGRDTGQSPYSPKPDTTLAGLSTMALVHAVLTKRMDVLREMEPSP